MQTLWDFRPLPPGDKLQTRLSNERGTVNLSIRVSDITIRQEHFRILPWMISITNWMKRTTPDTPDPYWHMKLWIRHSHHFTERPLLTLIQGSEELKQKVNLSLPTKKLLTKSAYGHTISTTGKDFSLCRKLPSFHHLYPQTGTFLVLRQRFYQSHGGTGTASISWFTYHFPPHHSDDLILYADENLISQVLINLLKMPFQAIEVAEIPEGIITLHAYCNEKWSRTHRSISNNGPIFSWK